MNKIMLAFVAALALFTVGCKKKGGGADAVAKWEDFKKKMCECKEGDGACAQKVLDEEPRPCHDGRGALDGRRRHRCSRGRTGARSAARPA